MRVRAHLQLLDVTFCALELTNHMPGQRGQRVQMGATSLTQRQRGNADPVGIGTHVRVDGGVEITVGTAAARPGAASCWTMCSSHCCIICWRGTDCDGDARPFPGLDHHHGGRPLGARLPAGAATPIRPTSSCCRCCCLCRLQLLSCIQQVLDDASVQLQPGGIIHRQQARLLHVRGHSDEDVRLDPSPALSWHMIGEFESTEGHIEQLEVRSQAARRRCRTAR